MLEKIILKHKLHYLSARHKVGAIIRTTDDKKRYPILKKAVENLLAINVIQLIHVMIYQPKDEEEIKNLLIKDFGKEKKRIQIESISFGNFYDDLLNFAISEQTRRGVDYSLSVSSEAYPYITEKNINKVLKAATEGALAIGLHIKEYSHITKLGYLSNAFSMYRNSAVNFVDTWRMHSLMKEGEDKKNEKNFGMEELIVVKHIIEKFGYKSIAIVETDEGWLHEHEDEKLRKARNKMIETKEIRFMRMCEILKIDLQELSRKIIWKK